jgi:C-terminal processing protease CtpA/Prc
MKRIILIVGLTFIINSLFPQISEENKYNLGFELINPSTKLPLNWTLYQNPDYTFSVDSIIKTSGKYSLKIETTHKQNLKSSAIVTIDIPADFESNQLELKVKIKLQNIKNGNVNFGLIQMKGSKSLQSNDLSDKGISGDIDWTEYSTIATFKPESETCKIVFQLTGTGTVWIDDFRLFIDRSNYFSSPKRFGYHVKLDKEFDEGSKIVISNLNSKIISNLTVVAKIWGFLKYYHPNVANGSFNWDYELFRIIPKVLETKSSQDRNQILSEWIKRTGEISSYNQDQQLDSSSIKVYPDLIWTKDNKILSGTIVSQLEKIRQSKRSTKNYYTEFLPQRNPSFRNEESYSYNKYPDTGFRLLSLFRIWNIIQYYYPYKYLIGDDWNKVLPEFIPKFINAHNDIEYRLVMLKLLTRLNDSHANIPIDDEVINNYKGKYTMPFIVSYVEGKMVVTDFLTEELEKKNQFKRGDIILSVNGENYNSIIKNRFSTTTGSNYSTKLRNIARDFLRTNDTMLKINYESEGIKKTQKVRCVPYNFLVFYNRITSPKEDYYKLLDKDVGYINLGVKKSAEFSKIMDDFINTKGIIIDLRYMPDFSFFNLCEYIMPDSKEFVKITNTNNQMPGLFSYGQSLKVGKKNPYYYKGKIVTLINENTQSRAEYVAMAFKTNPNSIFIGSTTAGADGDVSIFVLPGDVRIMITGTGIYYPDGSETQRIGILPDFVVKPTINGIKENRDELLESAIKQILIK